MAGPKPHFSPHAAFASAPDLTADSDAEVAIFRLLLPRAFSDADAIRLYAAIAPLRRSTAALQVRVDVLDASDADGGRVAVVLGPASPTRCVEASSSSGKPLVLSPAQEALIAVLDSGVLHCDERRGPEVVTCLVLVEAPQLEAAFGRGILGAIAREAGAEVCVAPWEEDARPPEEIIEITGHRTAVRKAIVAVSSCLQGDLPHGKSTTSVKTASPMLPWTSSELPEPNIGALHTEVSTECANSNILQIDCPQGVTGDVKTKNLQQISFRLLCHVNLAGGLIGKKGSVIKGFEDETGASIDVSAPISGCMERVITISALESPEPRFSMVQGALLRIFDRMEEIASNGRLMLEEPSQCLVRILVLKSQSGCLLGLDGAKEMGNSRGARIQILSETDLPACASHYEQVLQITGELVNVRDALCLVSQKLRNHAFSSKRTNYNDGYVPSSDIAQSTASSQVNISSTGYYSTDNIPRFDHGPSLNEMDSVKNSFRALHLGSPGSSGLEKPTNGNDVGINNANHEMQKPANRNCIGINNSNNCVQKPANGNGNEINTSDHGITSPEENKHASCRGINTATIVRSTYEIVVCGSTLYLIYGDNGNNLAQLREISGADITIYDPPPETSDCKIMISGTPDQTQSALAMLIDLIQA